MKKKKMVDLDLIYRIFGFSGFGSGILVKPSGINAQCAAAGGGSPTQRSSWRPVHRKCISANLQFGCILHRLQLAV